MSHAPAIRRLRDYVAIPSVNPMGRDDLPAAIAGEARYAERICEDLRRLGLDALRVGSDARPSVVAEARVSGATETLLVASHLDTVPVDGMEIDPFDPRVEGDRVFGRGSCDTKAGMAALLEALAAALSAGSLRRNLIVVGESDEEAGSRGARDVIGHLEAGAADWGIATEPTGLRVVTAHKGIARVRLEAAGRACHSSDPGQGRNAIVALARAVLALEGLGGELAGRIHPELGPPTLSVGRIGGGQAANVVPDSAWLELDRRMVPGEDAESVVAEIERRLAACEDVRLAEIRVAKPALGTARSEPVVEACRLALRAAGAPDEPSAVAFGTDAGIFSAAGIPSVVFGPGSIEQAHTSREYVEIRQVEAAVAIFRHLLEG